MFLLKTGCTDPGFIPRARSDEAAYNQTLGELGKLLYKNKVKCIHALTRTMYIDDNNTAAGYAGVPARYKTVVVNGQEVKLKYCVTCGMFRPPRASHCGLCNSCAGKMLALHIAFIYNIVHNCIFCLDHYRY